MNKFRKIWNKEKNEFLLKHKEMNRRELYELFIKTFPDAYDVTSTAFFNQRSRIGAVSDECKKKGRYKGSRAPKTLFSEHTKKGYVRIKVEQPNKWMLKHHYVWWINTGHKPIEKKEMIIFLDGNNRNFDFENLFLIPKNAIAIFNNPNLNLGLVQGNPELTKINAMNAMLFAKTREVGRKLGIVNSQGKFKDDVARKQRERYQSEKNRIKAREASKRYYHNMKKNNPEKYEEMLRKHREYIKNYKKK